MKIQKLSLRVMHFAGRFGLKLLKYLRIQFFLTLCSLPILLSWGLPLSYASIIGNFIFTPFLTLFLLLSSLIFFTELLYIPNGLIIVLLEWLASIWLYFISFSNRTWLFVCPSYGISIALPILAASVIMYKKFHNPIKSTLMLILLIIGYGASFKLTIPNTTSLYTIPCFKKNITLIQNGTEAFIHDPGCIGRRVSAPTWISYTLIPQLIKRGITKVSIVCEKPSATTFRALITLVETVPVDSIYLPVWKSCKKNTGWCAWQQLLTIAQHYKTGLASISEKRYVNLGNYLISLKSEEKMVKKNGISYYPLKVLYQKK